MPVTGWHSNIVNGGIATQHKWGKKTTTLCSYYYHKKTTFVWEKRWKKTFYSHPKKVSSPGVGVFWIPEKRQQSVRNADFSSLLWLQTISLSLSLCLSLYLSLSLSRSLSLFITLSCSLALSLPSYTCILSVINLPKRKTKIMKMKVMWRGQVWLPILGICALLSAHTHSSEHTHTHTNSCRTWDLNSQPLGYESDSLTIRPWLPLHWNSGDTESNKSIVAKHLAYP